SAQVVRERRDRTLDVVAHLPRPFEDVVLHVLKLAGDCLANFLSLTLQPLLRILELAQGTSAEGLRLCDTLLTHLLVLVDDLLANFISLVLQPLLCVLELAQGTGAEGLRLR